MASELAMRLLPELGSEGLGAAKNRKRGALTKTRASEELAATLRRQPWGGKPACRTVAAKASAARQVAGGEAAGCRNRLA